MTFKYRYRKQIIIGIIIFLIISGIITFSIYHFLTEEKEEDEEPIALEKKVEKKTKTEETTKVEYKVDIKGEINMPGIYTLKENSRVIDVIELAGGLTEEANTSVINLSKKVTDEMVIIVYSNREVEDFEHTKEVEKVVQEKCNQKDENSLVNGACISSPTEETTNPQIGGKISINTATKEELMTLPGIGENKAKDIINYRESNGPFATIEDITKVSGIGESIFAQIKENITV